MVWVILGIVALFIAVSAYALCFMAGIQSAYEERRDNEYAEACQAAPCPTCGCADDVTCEECAATERREEGK